MSTFDEDIEKFNRLYRLPHPTTPTLTAVGDATERLENFKNILAEELEEVQDILNDLKTATLEDELTILTKIADWLGDIQVYAASEAAKFGLPNQRVLSLIMASNFSKADENGNPIYDERGKVMKGPGYFKPEPAIFDMLSALIE